MSIQCALQTITPVVQWFQQSGQKAVDGSAAELYSGLATCNLFRFTPESNDFFFFFCRRAPFAMGVYRAITFINRDLNFPLELCVPGRSGVSTITA